MPQTPETQKKKNKKGRIRRLSDSRLAMMILSVLIAIVIWFVISITVYPTTTQSFYHIPLTVMTEGTVAEENGLSVIDFDVDEVSVQLEGNRSQVGNLSADDLVAVAVIEDVDNAGTKKLSIDVVSNDGTTFDVKSVTPSSVNVKFDYMDTYTFDIVPSAPNITFANGCILDEDNYLCSPSTIEVTGPRQELDSVAYCMAETDQTELLSASKILTTESLSFYNEKGTQIDDSNFSYDLARVSIEFPILYQKTLDITYQLTNVPANFNTDSLNLSLSTQEITLAAPTSAIDELREFNIGSIALRDIDIGYSQDFIVTIPEDYENVSGISTVTLTLDDTGLARKDFVLTDIGVINAPASYDFEVLTQQLIVSMVGDEDEIEQLDASDITVNVDLMSYTAQADSLVGDTLTFSYTPMISCSSYDSVWATGNYSVYVQGVRVEEESEDSDDADE